MAALLAAAATAALWPDSRPVLRPSAEPAAEEVQGTVEPCAWSRFADATARAMSRRPGRVRSGLASSSFDLEAADVEEAMGLLGEDLPEEAMFRLARALQRHMSPERARAAVARLRAAPRRSVALHALLGRTEVQAEVASFFLHDPDVDVRATAAFLLQEVSEGLPPEVWETARANVVGAPDPLRIESMELLAARPLDGADAQLIASQTGSPEVRIAAARALAAGKADASVLRPVLESLARDPSIPEEGRTMAFEALRRL